MIRLDDVSWWDKAACAGGRVPLAVFFSDDEDDIATAKATCSGCSRAGLCRTMARQVALDLARDGTPHYDDGTFGGETADERQAWARQVLKEEAHERAVHDG